MLAAPCELELRQALRVRPRGVAFSRAMTELLPASVCMHCMTAAGTVSSADDASDGLELWRCGDECKAHEELMLWLCGLYIHGRPMASVAKNIAIPAHIESFRAVVACLNSSRSQEGFPCDCVIDGIYVRRLVSS